MRRVAVTGFGVVSPIGVGKRAYWDALRAGRGGVGPITRFDCRTFDVRLGGEARDELSLPEQVARVARKDPKVGFAYAAFAEAVADLPAASGIALSPSFSRLNRPPSLSALFAVAFMTAVAFLSSPTMTTPTSASASSLANG